MSEAADSNLQKAVLAMVLLSSFATPLMLSAVNVALPAIAGDLALDAVALSWVQMAYLMGSAMFVLIFGRLADMLGRKRVFLLGTAAVLLSSTGAALASGSAVLLGMRFLQGVSTAMLYATQTAIVASVFPVRQRGRAIGLVVAAVYVGLASGPLLGGLLVGVLGWRASFLIQVPLLLAVLLFGAVRVKQEWSSPRRQRFDLQGAVTWAGGILLFCLGVSRLPDAGGWVLLLGAAAAVALFVRHARRTGEPLWDVRLFFSNRLFTLSSAASLIMYSATYANLVLVSLYLQYLKGLPPGTAGLVMMVQPLAMALLSPLMGRLSDRIEPRLLATAGMTLTAGGLVMLALLDGGSGMPAIVFALLLTGIGFSLFSSPNVNAIMSSVTRENYGSATGAVGTTRIIGQLASMVLVALALTLVVGEAAIGPANYPDLERAITLSFSIAALLCLPGIVLSLLRGQLHRPPAAGGQA